MNNNYYVVTWWDSNGIWFQDIFTSHRSRKTFIPLIGSENIEVSEIDGEDLTKLIKDNVWIRVTFH